DWRSGIPVTPATAADVRSRAQRIADLLVRRGAKRLLYVPAALPPIFSDPADNASLAHWLLSLASSLDARVLSSDVFSLGIYLATGCPVAGAGIAAVAEAVVDLGLSEPVPSR